MPTVKIAVAKSYPAHAEDAARSKGVKGDPKRGLSPASEWELGRVRAFLAGEPPNNTGIIRIYMNWEELEEITDVRTGKPFHVKFDPTKALPLGNPKAGKGEVLRALPLSDKMVEWLAKGVAFSREAVKQLNAVKGLPKQAEGLESWSSTVSGFLSLYLQAEARESRVRAEVASLDAGGGEAK